MFAIAYLAVRLLHLLIFWIAAGDDYGLRGQLIRFAPSVIGSTALLLVASQLHGTAQTWTWVAVVAVDYAGTILAGASGWRLNSAAHFAERHGLILIIAIGESIIAIGAGVASLPISAPIVAASVLGLALAAAIWWAYFDVGALIAERALRRSSGEARARLARDAYSYLHLPMVAGIVLLALGLKQVLAFVGGEAGHDWTDPLETGPLVAMYCGVALYLLALVAFHHRVAHTIKWLRVTTALVVLALAPVASGLPALGSLAVVTAVVVAMIAIESVRFAEARERIRHEEDEEESAADRSAGHPSNPG